MKYLIPMIAGLGLMLASCDRSPEKAETGAGGASASGASAPGAAPAGGAPSALPQGDAAAAPSAALAGRTAELVNPDEQTMIFLYYDLAGLAPPIESWISEDSDVRYGPAEAKPARREELRAAYAAAQASVRNVGRLRLTVQSNLSEYDPSYGEFTVQALAPGSTYDFRAFSRSVTLRLANGQAAQRWAVAPAEAQKIKDRVSYLRSTQVDVLLQITGVQPGKDGGSITANVISYEIRDRSAGVLGRVQVAP
ncbi:hypothetical protein ACO2Q1_08345 [Brevundimonas sp. VNH65]|uniref:hypothetical protein n=1 Tax=Brevundimonas sp. VNH65 TaxID=3400917 RepID=UPI003C06084B